MTPHQGRACPRVLHAPMEVAGQIALTAHALRIAGLPATAFCARHPFDYGVGPDVVPAVGAPLRYGLQVTGLIARHDVVHFHYGRTFLDERRRYADAHAIARLGRQVAVSFYGSEVRRPSVERSRNPYYVPFAGEDDAVAEERMRRWSKITGGHAVVLDPALVDQVEPYFASVHFHRAMIDVRRYVARPPDPRTDRPLVVHSPTARPGKGTVHVRAAVQALRARGIEFEYTEVFGLDQEEALRIYAAADLVIDQLCVGSHGVFALEAMSMAKPVLCHIGEAVRDRFPDDLPLVLANPDTVTEVLAHWIGRPQDRHDRGLQGRAYVEREHDVRAVGPQLVALYSEMAR